MSQHAAAGGLDRRQADACARLVEMIGKVPHDLYAEPFVGMGASSFAVVAFPPAE